MDDWLTDREYAAMLLLYNEFPAAYQALPEYMQAAFIARLLSKK